MAETTKTEAKPKADPRLDKLEAAVAALSRGNLAEAQAILGTAL